MLISSYGKHFIAAENVSNDTESQLNFTGIFAKQTNFPEFHIRLRRSGSILIEPSFSLFFRKFITGGRLHMAHNKLSSFQFFYYMPFFADTAKEKRQQLNAVSKIEILYSAAALHMQHTILIYVRIDIYYKLASCAVINT